MTDPELNVQEDRWITMNQPLEYRGYKFFQSGLDSAGVDRATLLDGRVLLVGREPDDHVLRVKLPDLGPFRIGLHAGF